MQVRRRQRRVEPVGTVTREQLRTIAEIKMPDLNAGSIEAAMKVVQGTARSMGIWVSVPWHGR